jgi:hypothetical protein
MAMNSGIKLGIKAGVANTCNPFGNKNEYFTISSRRVVEFFIQSGLF